MTLLEYQDGYINVEAISCIYLRELDSLFEEEQMYDLILRTTDGHTYSCFKGNEESCKREMAEIISLIKAKVVR